MIDKLLKRLAGSSAPAGSAQHSEPMRSSISAGQYPARSAAGSCIQPAVSNAWLAAAEIYVQECAAGRVRVQLSHVFAGWSRVHLELAQLLWMERNSLHKGIIHVHSGSQLLVWVQPLKRRVWLRVASYDAQQPLLLRQLNLQGDNSPPGSDFQAHDLHSLMWFYGQASAEAVWQLPQSIGTQHIQLKKFPLVAPATLQMHHLALLHAFSAGEMGFACLQSSLPPEQRGSLCADIASLYFTGTLRLLPSTSLQSA